MDSLGAVPPELNRKNEDVLRWWEKESAAPEFWVQILQEGETSQRETEFCQSRPG